jgi:cytochrome c biogenesis protein CcmG/thiol:disulfide interchange protein DsbE
MNRQKLIQMLPLLIMFLISAALGLGLFSDENGDINQVNNGKKLSGFELPSLGKATMFTPELFGGGRVKIVNVFASWCVPCAQENDLLMKLAQKANIYGIAWKDKPIDAFNFLKENGNPYQEIGIDEEGITTVPLAITGVPETYVLDKDGKIALHYKSPLNDDVLNNLVIPLVNKLNSENAQAR